MPSNLRSAVVSSSRPYPKRWVSPLALALILAAALLSGCGGDDETADAETTPTTDSTVPSTLNFDTTTTTTGPPTTASTLATSTTIDPSLIAPLTGLAVDDADELDRPALVLKIDNHPNARPQTGLDQADLVFDLRAEGVTRFTAVFHSQIPATAGPVRSSRTSDFDILSGLDRPLYGSSGGNDYVISALRNIDTVALTNHTRSEYYRNSSRPAPHNLYIDPNDLYALAPTDTTAPQPWFTYRGPDDGLPATATPTDGEVTVAFRDGPTAGFTWSEDRGGWLRTQNGAPHLTVEDVQIAPANVVIMVTTYRTSPADPISPEVVSVGSGEALILTDGHEISGTWSRPAATDKPTLTDSAGNPVALNPGQTWILYPEAGQVRP